MNIGREKIWDRTSGASASLRPLVDVDGLDNSVLLLDEVMMKHLQLIHDNIRARDLVQTCIQLLLAFGDDGGDTLVFELDGRKVSIGKSRVRRFKFWNLPNVNVITYLSE